MLLAIDYGERYVGLAAADPPDTPVHRLGTIDQKKESLQQRLLELVQKQQVSRILVGVPVGLSGQETEQTHVSLMFIEFLRELLGPEVEVEGVDETLTSVEAQQVLEREGARAEDEHAEAARLMLETYIRTKDSASEAS